jgi:hypothetical protein
MLHGSMQPGLFLNKKTVENNIEKEKILLLKNENEFKILKAF